MDMKKRENEAIKAFIKWSQAKTKLVKVKKIRIPKKYTFAYSEQVKCLRNTKRRTDRIIGERVRVLFQPSHSPVQVVGLTGKIVRVIQDVNGYKVYEVAFKTKVPSYSFRTGKPVLTFSETDVEFVNPKLR